METEVNGELAKLVASLLGHRPAKFLAWVGVGIFLCWGVPFAFRQIGLPFQPYYGEFTWQVIRDILIVFGYFFGFLAIAGFLLAVMLGFAGRLTGIVLYRRQIGAIQADVAMLKADIYTMKGDIAAIKEHLGIV